jgi:DNA-directed RNA polymerase subunit RPC12/RpoP
MFKESKVNKIACPHCGQPGGSFVRKMFLGPAISTKCTSCGKKFGVPTKKSVVAFTPFVIAIFISGLIDPIIIRTAFLFFVFIIASIIQIKYVPLEAR